MFDSVRNVGKQVN